MKTYPGGSQPARLYGNPKTHKLKSELDKLTFYPMVSFIGTYNYKLAKFLTSMLDPVIPKDHCTKDSFLFCKDIKKVSSTNKFLISYDICSLFTSTPLNVRIDLAVELIFDNNPTVKLQRKISRSFLNLQLQELTFFLMEITMIKLMVQL